MIEIRQEINRLESAIELLYEEAELAGSISLPDSLYARLDELDELRGQAARLPVRDRANAIAALELVLPTTEDGRAIILERVIRYLQAN